MACPHCMRGDAMNQDLDITKLKRFLKDVKEVRNITFTGGEPTLNIKAINETLKICRELDITVYSFYLVTNGKVITDNFLKSMIDWHVYTLECNSPCIDDTINGVALSKDMFHEEIDEINLFKLKSLSFFRDKDKNTDWDKSSLLNIGRSKNLNGFKKREHFTLDIENIIDSYDDNIEITDTVTFTCNGEILKDCDYAYEDTDKLKVADYDNVIETFSKYL